MTIVQGGPTLEACLEALNHQVDAPPLQVIVPYDDSVDIEPAKTRFEAAQRTDCRFEFVGIGAIETGRPPGHPAGQHELFDRRRAAGLARATGELVAILEDRGVPRPDWAATAQRLHALPHAVIGGVVDNGVDNLLHWAVYFCDFSRYAPPVEAGPREYVTDVNVCYKRSAIERTKDLWTDRYHETTVHWALQRDGETLYLSSELVVDQMRGQLSLTDLLVERYHWGRLFAYTRAKEASLPARLSYAAATPLLPGVLLVRHLRSQADKPKNRVRFLKAAPVVAALLTSWCLGEASGYLTGRP